MANFFGSIDLTELGNIVRTHPELVRNIQMRDGTTHKFINIDVLDKGQPDQYGHSASIKVSCKKEQRKEGVKYFISNLKVSQYGGQQQTQQQQSVLPPPPPPGNPDEKANDGLPF